MGRGLSDLQRWIVDEAGKRKGLPGYEDRLYYADICEGYFGWEREPGAGKGPGSPKFSLEKIGRAEYNRVKATISRSCARLEARGLVRCLRAAHSRWAAVVAELDQEAGE